MKFLVSVFAMLGLVLAGTVSAQADTPGYVTTQEYVDVQKDWTKKRVHKKFDTNGVTNEVWKKNGHDFEQRRYLTNQSGNVVYVNFRKKDGEGAWRLRGKMWCTTQGCVTG